MRNAIGREIPERIGSREVIPFGGAFATLREDRKAARHQKCAPQHEEKMLPSIEAAIEATGLSDGMTVSFHHSFRDGDRLINQVLDACAQRGLKDLRLLPTALFPVHAGIVDHIKSGLISRIEGSMNGPIGAFVSQGGKLSEPAILRSHVGAGVRLKLGTWESTLPSSLHRKPMPMAMPRASRGGRRAVRSHLQQSMLNMPNTLLSSPAI